MSEMDGVSRLAALLKDRENVENFNISTVTLISKSPVSFRVSDKLFINKEYGNMVLSSSVSEYVSRETTVSGEVFIAIPTPDGNTWFVIDKAVI